MQRNDSIYKTIIENIGQDIFVSDGEGNIIFVNPASIEVNRLDAHHVIGRNVSALVEEGYFSESSTLKAIEKRAAVSVLQTNKIGKKFISTSTPLFDHNGNISLVISTSHDVESLNSLFEALEEQGVEIAALKHELSESVDLAPVDSTSAAINSIVAKVGMTDIPLLISGEAGTGKRSTAREIHLGGKRKDMPLITINCSTANADLLDVELFGAETFSNNHVHITKGRLEFADGGTLILNEIGDMPYNLQTKLMTYIETGTFTRSGGTTPVTTDTRIIALSNTGLKDKTQSGLFKKELYYALNSVPIMMPALRDRKADIPCLSRLYLSRCNAKYGERKIITSGALAVLSSHNWPGNLIELSQAIESTYIMTDGHMISGETVYKILYGASTDEDANKILCTDIIPLKEAKKQLEEQLVKRAYEVYGTTYKAAEILKVDQSTVSKILKKYK